MSEGRCPACDADMDGGPIPENIVHNYILWDIGKQGNTAALSWLKDNPDEWPHWQRRIGIEVQGEYDGVLIWKCPDCKHVWPRFPNEGYWESLHNKAVNIVNNWKQKERNNG